MPSQQPLRRSARQRGLAIPESKPKKARLSLNHPPPIKSPPRRTSLLLLPDDSISRIFFYLGAFDTSGTFQTPRHAFQLALTNTRFLYLFSCGFTSIIPTVSNEAANTLSYAHFLTVLRMTGHFLRELRLPKSSAPILPLLPDLCPNLRNLSFIDNIESHKILDISRTFKIPLCSLTVTRPTRHMFPFLSPPPTELILEATSPSSELRRLLHTPPKRLLLSFQHRYLPCARVPGFFTALYRACSKIEDLTLKFPPNRGDSNLFFRDEAKKSLRAPRRNHDSKCRKLVIENGPMTVITQAHPNAVLEVRYADQTFVSDGKGIYAKRLPLCSRYLQEDVSRLTEVMLGPHVKQEWRRLLSGMRLSLMTTKFNSFHVAALCARVEVLEVCIRVLVLSDANWVPLHTVGEIRITNEFKSDDVNEILELLYGLAQLLSIFFGKTLWMQHHLKFAFRRGSVSCSTAVMVLRNHLHEFEARGGDAGTVRAIVNDVQWC